VPFFSMNSFIRFLFDYQAGVYRPGQLTTGYLKSYAREPELVDRCWKLLRLKPMIGLLTELAIGQSIPVEPEFFSDWKFEVHFLMEYILFFGVLRKL
jgi:hypothetical protein